MPSRVRSIHGSTAEPLPDVYRVLVSIIDQKPWWRLPTPPEEQAFKRIHHHTVTTTRFVPPLVDLAPFHRWNYGTKIALNCPFEQRDEAKDRGARWDPKDKSWYVTDNMDLNPFKEWLPAPSVQSGVGSSSAGTPNTVSRKRCMHS